MQYDRVLLPVDDDQEIASIVEHAAGLAGGPDATVHVLYVIDERQFTDPAPLSQSGMDVATDELLAAYREVGEEVLEHVSSAVASRDEGIRTECVLRQGVPYEVICQYAAQEGMGAVVMATHRQSGRDRQLLGSVTERVVRSSSVPVFVVPPVA